MTSIVVGGDAEIEGSIIANNSNCAGTFSFVDANQAAALGAPSSYTVTQGANGGAGANGGPVYENGGLACGAYGGAGPSGRTGGNGGLSQYTSIGGVTECPVFFICESVGHVVGCYPYGINGGGGAAGGSGQGLFLKVAGRLSGTGTIDASGTPGENGGNGGSAAAYYSAGGAGGGGAGGGGGTVVIRVHGDISTAQLTTLPVQVNTGAGAGGTGGAGGGGYTFYSRDRVFQILYFTDSFYGSGGGGNGDSGSPGLTDVQSY